MMRHRFLATMAKILVVPFLASAPCTAHADVLEVSGDHARWVAGGPSTPSRQHRYRLDSAFTTSSRGASPAAWAPVIARLSRQYDLAPALIEALVWQESRWNPNAVSPKGARGLAQLMPATARALGVNQDDPLANIDAGARYLRGLLDFYHGNLDKALAAYNAGPGRVSRTGRLPRIAETQHYVAAIMANLASRTRDDRIRR